MTLTLCPKCHIRKYDPDRYDGCYTCNMEEQGKKLCSSCLENYYDPSLYQECFACFKERQSDENDDDEPDLSADISSAIPHP